MSIREINVSNTCERYIPEDTESIDVNIMDGDKLLRVEKITMRANTYDEVELAKKLTMSKESRIRITYEVKDKDGNVIIPYSTEIITENEPNKPTLNDLLNIWAVGGTEKDKLTPEEIKRHDLGKGEGWELTDKEGNLIPKTLTVAKKKIAPQIWNAMTTLQNHLNNMSEDEKKT